MLAWAACATAQTAPLPNYAPQMFQTGGGWGGAVGADMNGDGKTDIVAAGYLLDAVVVMLGTTAHDADAPTLSAERTFVAVPSPVAVAAVDMDGDGRPDVVALTGDLNGRIFVALNTTPAGSSKATFAEPHAVVSGLGSSAGGFVVADLNGDGKPDIVVTDDTSGYVIVLVNVTPAGSTDLVFSGRAVGGAQVVFGGDSITSFVTVADINGDGMPDLVVGEWEYISGYTISVLFNAMSPGGKTPEFADPQTIVSATGQLFFVGSADLNGDARPDVIYLSNRSVVSVSINTTAPGAAHASFTQPHEFSTPANPRGVSAIDVDGDGKLDLFVGSLGSGLTVLLNATANNALAPAFVAQQLPAAGRSMDLVTAGDFNADGKQDLIVSNRSSGIVTALLDIGGAPGIDLDQHGLTGSWFDPATGGQGLEIELYPDLLGAGQGVLFGGWFTYGDSSDPVFGQRWYALEGSIDDKDPFAHLGIYAGYGGNFAAPPAIPATQVGTASLRFTDCTHAQLYYFFSDGRVGSIALSRLTANISCGLSPAVANAPSAYLLSGSWFDASTAGQGLVFDINPVQSNFFAAWYTYIPNGQQFGKSTGTERWYTIQAAFPAGATGVDKAAIYTDTGGVFNDPTPPKPQKVGTATVTFESCTQATLSYAFDTGPNITNNAMSGTIQLTRTGPMPAGCSF